MLFSSVCSPFSSPFRPSSGPPRAHSKRPCVLGGGVLVVSLVSPSFSVENVSLSHCLRVRSSSSSCSAGVLLDTQDL